MRKEIQELHGNIGDTNPFDEVDGDVADELPPGSPGDSGEEEAFLIEQKRRAEKQGKTNHHALHHLTHNPRRVDKPWALALSICDFLLTVVPPDQEQAVKTLRATVLSSQADAVEVIILSLKDMAFRWHRVRRDENRRVARDEKFKSKGRSALDPTPKSCSAGTASSSTEFPCPHLHAHS